MADKKPNSKTDKPTRSKQNKKSFESELADAIKDLSYISETDAPLETFVWRRETGAEAFSEINASLILQLTKKTAGECVREQSLEDFFRYPTTEQDWYGEEEKETVCRYKKLENFLQKNLRAAKVFKIGEVEVEIYVVGIDANGNLAGVKTKAVET